MIVSYTGITINDKQRDISKYFFLLRDLFAGHFGLHIREIRFILNRSGAVLSGSPHPVFFSHFLIHHIIHSTVYVSFNISCTLYSHFLSLTKHGFCTETVWKKL